MFSNLSRDICGGETVLLFYRDEEDLHHRNVKLRYEISDRALHHAALSGRKHLVCILLQYGHNVNARERINGKTALHYAKSKEIARILLASGAIVDARDRNSLDVNVNVKNASPFADLQFTRILHVKNAFPSGEL